MAGQKIGWTLEQIANNLNDKVSPTDLVTDLVDLMGRVKEVTEFWEKSGREPREEKVARVLNPALDNFLFELRGIRP